MAVALLLTLWAHPVSALETGDPLLPLRLEDQHGTMRELTAARWLVFTHDRRGGELVRGVIGDRDQAALTAVGLALVSDISAMPRAVTRMFALPAMRKSRYRLLLDRNGRITAGWPRRPEQATLIELNEARVESVRFIGQAAALATALDMEPPKP